jgi:hypothetical protein
MNTKSNNSVSKVLFHSFNFDKQGIKKLLLCLKELSLLIDQDKDGRTLTNLIMLRYCEGVEFVKQAITDSIC